MNPYQSAFAIATASLFLTACGENLSAQAKKAASEITAEAKKTASQKIDEARNETIDQLKQIRVESGSDKDKKSGNSEAKNASDKGK